MNKRLEVIEHNGKKIIYANYTGLRGEDFVNVIAQQESESLKSQDKNILHLLNFTDCKMDREAQQRAEAMLHTLSGKGYTVKTACFGITGIQRIIANAVKRDMYFAPNIDDAKDWLTK